MTRITMLLSNHYGPDPRVQKEADYLASCGHTVEVLALDYRNRLRSKPVQHDGSVLIRRIFTSPESVGEDPESWEPITRFLYRIPFFWHFESLRHLLRYSKRVQEHLRDNPTDYLHGHDLSGAWVGMRVKKSLRIVAPLIFDMHEDYVTATKKKARFRWFIKRFVHHLQNHAQHILYVHPKQIEDATQKNRQKALCLPNYPHTQGFKPLFHAAQTERLRVVYVGHILLETLDLHKNFFDAAYGLPIDFVIYGDGWGFKGLQELAQQYPNVTLRGHFDQKTDLPLIYAQADVSYLVYDYQSIGGRWPLATKFYDTLCAGVPFIVEHNTDMGDYAQSQEVGLAVDTYDIASIREALESLAKNPDRLTTMRSHIKTHDYRSEFSWENGVVILDMIYPTVPLPAESEGA
jgi:glycosyltransferase involved in cell wall biosynthesis